MGHSSPSKSTMKTKRRLKGMSKKEERRLVEYFVIVSSEPRRSGDRARPDSPRHKVVNSADDSFSSVTSAESDSGTDFAEETDFQPVITARYPMEDHEDNPLHESVTAFCHPVGAIRLRTESTMPKVHYFVSTGGKGQQMYGTCLTVFEPYTMSASPKKPSKHGYIKTKEAYLPRCICILSSYPYLVAFREYLSQLHRLSKSGEMTIPIERYVVNFCAEIPAPPPGSFEVQTTILDSVIKFWSPPHNQPIVWVSLPFSHLLECLDVNNIILVWHALALERQVLITSTQLSLLTTCSEILISLLFPMRWSHAYIPVLPHFLIPILSAPMPYLCGIDKTNLSVALYDLSRDCIMVDLDKNTVTMGPSTPPLPPLPSAVKQSLRNRLEKNVGATFREARSLTRKHDYSDRGLHLPDHVRVMADAMWESRLCLFDEAFHLSYTPETIRQNMLNGNDSSGMEVTERDLNNPTVPIRIMTKEEKQNLRKQSQWDAMQEAFVDTFVFLLRNHRKFLVFPSKNNEGSYGGAGFRSKEFVEAQRSDMQPFLAELVDTQMFDDFVTKRLYGSGEADVTFFDRAIDRLMKSPALLANYGVIIGSRKTSIPAYGEKRGPDFRVSWQRVASLRGIAGGSSKKSKPQTKSPPSAGLTPLLQSARVHRKLKTIVPPEPSSADLAAPAPNNPFVVSAELDDDDVSVGSASTSGTHSTRGTRGSSVSGSAAKSNISRGAKAAKKRQSYDMADRHFYVYPSFPSNLDTGLYGKPRPLPSAVLAEFDKQRQNAAKFRRNVSNEADGPKSHLRQGRQNASVGEPVKENPPSAEVTTFTVFFLVFTAVVGKDLFELSSDSQSRVDDRTILSTYTLDTQDETDSEKQGDSDDEVNTSALDADLPVPSSLTYTNVEKDGAEANQKESAESEKVENELAEDQDEAKDNANDDDDGSTIAITYKNTSTSNGDVKDSPVVQKGSPNKKTAKVTRSRFKHKLSDLQIQEAKATAKAQLGLAFEMLAMMKQRGLKGDPAAYQCLIDACGRCGDTERATQLLSKMHDDGIVADGVVYSWLVTAFSTEQNALRQMSGKADEDLPDWANGASGEMDWNKLQKRSYIEIAKERLGNMGLGGDGGMEATLEQSLAAVKNDETASPAMALKKALSRRKSKGHHRIEPARPGQKNYVSEPVLRQILLGENLLEIVFPDISVDTDNELCPRCNKLLTDDEVVAGWSSADSQDYTTKCPVCSQKFVPHFCVQSTSHTFMGSRGMGTPLLCERLSPWVLLKELRIVMSDREGIEELLSPEWRDQETKNSVLWWNLILSFMRYRFPFSFLLQGSFDTNLIAPTPVDDTF